MAIEALIFDVDGTLADTEEAHRVAFNLAFERLPSADSPLRLGQLSFERRQDVSDPRANRLPLVVPPPFVVAQVLEEPDQGPV